MTCLSRMAGSRPEKTSAIAAFIQSTHLRTWIFKRPITVLDVFTRQLRPQQGSSTDFSVKAKTTIPEAGIMDLLKSIIARDVDGDLVDKDRNKVLKTDRKAEPKAKAAPRPTMGKF